MFDNVLLLGKGGRTVYIGPTKGVLPYFESLGFKCPEHVNPADVRFLSVPMSFIMSHFTSKSLFLMLSLVKSPEKVIANLILMYVSFALDLIW